MSACRCAAHAPPGTSSPLACCHVSRPKLIPSPPVTASSSRIALPGQLFRLAPETRSPKALFPDPGILIISGRFILPPVHFLSSSLFPSSTSAKSAVSSHPDNHKAPLPQVPLAAHCQPRLCVSSRNHTSPLPTLLLSIKRVRRNYQDRYDVLEQHRAHQNSGTQDMKWERTVQVPETHQWGKGSGRAWCPWVLRGETPGWVIEQALSGQHRHLISLPVCHHPEDRVHIPHVELSLAASSTTPQNCFQFP